MTAVRVFATGRAVALGAIVFAGLSGCMARPVSIRTNPDPTSRLDVSTLAPAINAGFPRIEPKEIAADPGVEKISGPSNPPLPDVNASRARSGRIAATLPDPGSPIPGRYSPAGTTPETIPVSGAAYPIDLSTSLRLADAENPTIAGARVVILGALAERTAARSLLLPSLNAGANYHDHTGNVQRSSGKIFSLSAQSLYLGGGVGALGTQTLAIPAVNIFSPITDAIFEPLAAQRRVEGARFDASATANSVLLDVARLFLDLVGARATLEARRQSASDADRIFESVDAFRATGQGRAADANRAEAERRLFQVEIQRAEEAVAVASARLSERLNLDTSIRLEPIAGPLEQIGLIDAETPPEELIRSALARRPELAARGAQVSQAQYRLKEERARPFLPTLWLGFSGGAFGGGSDVVPPTFGHLGDRTDFDVRAYWTLLNFGVGNASLIKRRRAEVGEAEAERARIANLVRSEIISARADSLAAREQVDIARAGLRSAEDGFKEDSVRLRETLGKPIEALDSLRLLADSRVSLISAIIRANRAQFALFVSLGSPPPVGPIEPAPAIPLPMTTPLHSPIVARP